MNLVVDSSVVIKWYTHESLQEQAVALRKRITEESISVAVPRFFFVEAANILWKKATLLEDLTRRDAKRIFSRILDLPLQVLEDDEALLRSLDLSLEHRLSIYDGMYLASALRFKATLITADAVLVKRLAGSVMARHVKYLGEL